jgi:hypothetical protein
MALPARPLIAEEPAQPPAQPAAPPPAQSAPPDQSKTPASAWETRHAGDVAMNSPYPIEDGPDVFPTTPEKVRSTLVSVKTYKAGGPKQGFQISVTIIVYKPGVPVDVDEAVKGVTNKITASIGDPDHKFIIQPTKLSGLDARQSQFHGTVHNGLPFYAALVVAQQGQKLWQVQAVCMNETVVQDLARVMNSITITPEP